MMKKIFYIICLLSSIFVISGCGNGLPKPENVSDKENADE